MILPKNVHYVNVSNYVQLLNSKYVLSREKIVKLKRLSRLCVLAYIGILPGPEGDARRRLQSNERHRERFVYGCSCSKHQPTAAQQQKK